MSHESQDKTDPFTILKISPNATFAQARHAYKRLVKLWHPDQFGDDPAKMAMAQERLKAINIAYKEVKDLIAATPIPGSSVPRAGAATIRGRRPSFHGHGTPPPSRQPGVISSFFINLLPKRYKQLLKSERPATGSSASPPPGHPSRPRPSKEAPHKEFQEVFDDIVRARASGTTTLSTKKRHPPRGEIRRRRSGKYRRPYGRIASYRPVRQTGDPLGPVEPIDAIRKVTPKK